MPSAKEKRKTLGNGLGRINYLLSTHPVTGRQANSLRLWLRDACHPVLKLNEDQLQSFLVLLVHVGGNVILQ